MVKKYPIVFKVYGDNYGNYQIEFGNNVNKKAIVEDFFDEYKHKDVKEIK